MKSIFGTKAERIGKAIASAVDSANRYESNHELQIHCFVASLLGSLDFLARDCGIAEVKEAREGLEKLVFPNGIPPPVSLPLDSRTTAVAK